MEERATATHIIRITTSTDSPRANIKGTTLVAQRLWESLRHQRHSTLSPTMIKQPSLVLGSPTDRSCRLKFSICSWEMPSQLRLFYFYCLLLQEDLGS